MAVSQEALTILLPLYMLDMGASPAFAALVVGLRGIGVLLFDVPAGMLVARFGDKPVLLGGLTLIFTGLTLAQRYDAAVARRLRGSGARQRARGVDARPPVVSRRRVRDQRARPRDRGDGGLAARRRADRPGGGRGARGVCGLSRAFAVGVASAVVAGATVLAFARAVPPHANPDASLAGTVQVLRDQRRVLATAGGSALVLQLMRATRQLLVPLFGQAVGLDVTTIGLVYSLSTVVDIALFYPSGVLADRLGRKWSAVPSMALYALGLALLPLAAGFYSLLAVAVLLGLANGIGTGVVMIIGADLARASGRHGQFLGLWRLIGDVGISGAPLHGRHDRRLCRACRCQPDGGGVGRRRRARHGVRRRRDAERTAALGGSGCIGVKASARP